MTQTETERAPVTVADADRALHVALAAAQAEFPPIQRDKTVTVRMREGGTYTFSYAPLDSILAAVRPVLAKHGLALIQPLEFPAGMPMIRTALLHAEGGRVAASFPVGTVPENLQALGSRLTYLRRYAVCAMLALAAEEDDDGGSGRVGQEDPREASPAEQARAAQPPGFVTPDSAADDISEKQRRMIYALKGKLTKAEKLTEEAWSQTLSARYGTEKVSELTSGQASDLIERLKVLEAAAGLE